MNGKYIKPNILLEEVKFQIDMLEQGGIDKDDFIEYGSLKETDVISWLEKNLWVDKMKENLEKQIEVLKTPVAKTYSNPFAKKEE